MVALVDSDFAGAADAACAASTENKAAVAAHRIRSFIVRFVENGSVGEAEVQHCNYGASATGIMRFAA
ncbi:hypothetical protein GCM10027093_59590 [Paraburkholderia jirisanensis]